MIIDHEMMFASQRIIISGYAAGYLSVQDVLVREFEQRLARMAWWRRAEGPLRLELDPFESPSGLDLRVVTVSGPVFRVPSIREVP